MKKLTLCLALICLLASYFTGCVKDNGNNNYDISGIQASGATTVPGTARQEISSAPARIGGADEPTGGDIESAERITVADAPMYRGTVTASSVENGVRELRLESAAGTDFGYPAITMHTDEYTRANFTLENVAQGDYLEVFYADRNNGLPPVIIAVNLLPPAVDCVYNGEVVKYEEGQNSSGTLEMTPLGGGDIAVFHFDESTNFYLNTGDLVTGARLNLFHRGSFTRSIPPQGFVYEVRPYNEY